MRIPTFSEAEAMLFEAERLNPGAWVNHSRVAAVCAQAIAAQCEHLNAETAYVLGLLHDIGRRQGVTDMRHIIDGYRFLLDRHYDTAARICLTHSFPDENILSYNGQNDCTENETAFIAGFLKKTDYDDYDRLIQLCDALSLPTGATYLEKRLVDVVLRRGFNEFTVPKWKAFLALKAYFDEKTGVDIYKLIKVT